VPACGNMVQSAIGRFRKGESGKKRPRIDSTLFGKLGKWASGPEYSAIWPSRDFQACSANLVSDSERRMPRHGTRRLPRSHSKSELGDSASGICARSAAALCKCAIVDLFPCCQQVCAAMPSLGAGLVYRCGRSHVCRHTPATMAADDCDVQGHSPPTGSSTKRGADLSYLPGRRIVFCASFSSTGPSVHPVCIVPALWYVRIRRKTLALSVDGSYFAGATLEENWRARSQLAVEDVFEVARQWRRD